MQLRRAGLATLAAALLGVSACAAPFPHKVTASPELPPPSPSASPTPTAPLAVSPVSFHGGEVGVVYAPVALSATGGLTPYKWSVISGGLPGGLTIGNDGSVAGTPTTAGTFSFTIQVTDAASSTASLPAASMAIVPAVTLGLIASCAQYCRVELGCDSSCGAFGQVGGGAGPYNYSFAGGQLPAGTSLNGLTLKGTFKGQSGWVQFTVQVTDGFGGTASVSPKFWMYDHIAWSGTYHCNGTQGTACQVQIPFTGGIPGGQPKLTLASVGAYCPPNFPTCPPPPANAPNGISNVTPVVGPNGGGMVTFTVAAGCGGFGGCPSGYYGAIGLVLVDQAFCGANARCQTGVATVDVYIQTG